MATIRKPKGSPSWIAQVRVRPFKPVAKSFATKAEAEEWADRHERTLREQRKRTEAPPPDLPRLTVAGLIKLFREEPSTKDLRTYDGLKKLLEWWETHYGSTRVLALGALTLRQARDKLRVGRKPATVNRYLSAMRSCWNWGRAAELVPRDLLWPARLMLTEPKGRTRYLSDDELAALLKAAAADSPQMYAAVLVSLGCGVRQSELLRLTWADVDLDRKVMRVLLTKNGESRSVHVPASVVEALRALKRLPVVGTTVIADAAGQPADKAWIEYRWRPMRTAAGLKDFKWHDLRHSCASFLAQNGANLLEIGAVLGHKSTSVTRRYAHLIEGAPVTGHTKLDEKLGSAK